MTQLRCRRPVNQKFSVGQTMLIRSGALLKTVSLVCPLAMSADQFLAPFFFAILSIVMIGTAWSRGTRWRDLLPLNPAIAVCLLLGAYLFVNAT